MSSLANSLSPPRRGAGPSARELEARLLDRCQAAAEGSLAQAADEREANQFELAAQLLPGTLELQSQRLHAAAAPRLGTGKTLDAAEIVRRGWVQSLPRLRQALVDRLQARP